MSVQFEPLRIGPIKVEMPVVLAPMAGVTNSPFRRLCRQFGAGLYVSEMISARALVEQNAKTHRLADFAADEKPRSLQLAVVDPAIAHKAVSALVEGDRVDHIDINFGCPVKRVTDKAKSGSYLLRTPDKMGEIISCVVKACAPTPVTAKIRLGCTRDKINAIDIAQVVEASGAAALTVHGRTAQDMFRGSADWDLISEIKPYLKKIPLIGNGDLDSPEKVVEAFRRYAVDGVMIARACLGRPWLFQQAEAALRGQPVPPDPTLAEQRVCMLRHYDLLVDRFGEDKAAQLMRRYACCYAQGRFGARHFRTHVAKVSSSKEFYQIVEDHFPRDLEPKPQDAEADETKRQESKHE